MCPISDKNNSNKLPDNKSSNTLTKTNSISDRSSENDAKRPGTLLRSKSAVNLSNSNFRKKAKKFQRSTTQTKARRSILDSMI